MMKVETRRNFSNKKTVVHAAALFTDFRKQKPGENIRNYIADYVRLMKESTEKTPKDDLRESKIPFEMTSRVLLLGAE